MPLELTPLPPLTAESTALTNAFSGGGLTPLDAPAPPASLYDMAVEHSRIDSDANQGDSINQYLRAAVEYVQERTGQQLFTARYRFELDRFPQGDTIKLPLPPLQNVHGITYTAADGTTQAMDPDAYGWIASRRPARIVLKPHASWPDAMPNSVQIDFTCGYGSAADSLPYLLRQAVLMVFAGWFEHREAASDRTITSLPVPIAVQNIIDAHRYDEAI